mmetsp:Transcript_25241/g.50346  ORF Transcript_25241/g.50346 Transcript_25241/m.50346 type:complete len:322 (+) Transcript_25241:394-1359(+)
MSSSRCFLDPPAFSPTSFSSSSSDSEGDDDSIGQASLLSSELEDFSDYLLYKLPDEEPDEDGEHDNGSEHFSKSSHPPLQTTSSSSSSTPPNADAQSPPPPPAPPPPPPSVFSFLPPDLLLLITTMYLPSPIPHLLSKQHLKTANASTRENYKSYMLSRLCPPHPSLPSVSPSYVGDLEDAAFAGPGFGLTASKAYHRLLRGILSTLSSVRSSSGGKGPLQLYLSVCSGRLSPAALVGGVLDGSVVLSSFETLARIQSQIAKHTLSRTLLSSRFKAQTKEYPHPCIECGGRMGVVEKRRKTDVDRVTLSVWCESCKVGFDL